MMAGLLLFARRFAPVVILLGFSAPAGAQPAATSSGPVRRGVPVPTVARESWTLEQAVNRALEANPDVLAAKYDVERQEGARIQMVARMLPQLTASANVNEREEGLVDNPPNPRNHQAPPDDKTGTALFGYGMRVEIRQNVFDGFSSYNQVRRQQLLSKQALLTLKSVVGQTISLVRQGFDAIQLRTAVVETEQRRLEEYAQLVDITSRKQKAGDIPEFELLRAQAEMEGVRADLAEANRGLAQAEQSFRRLLQLSDFSDPVKVVGRFEPRPFGLPLDEAVAAARLHRPDLQAAVLGAKAARKNELSERGALFPRFDVFASYDARSSYYLSNLQRRGWTYGVMGQWDLFDGGAARGRRMSLRAERRAAENRWSEAEQGIVSRLHELYQGLQQARVAMDAQRKSLGMSDRAWRDARRLYEVGQASLEQVLQASMTRRRADARLGESIYNFNTLVAEIEYSVGGELSDSVPVPDTWKP